MKEKIISFETAKLAKDKGLNLKNIKIDHYDINGNIEPKIGLVYLQAPTQSLLQKWLREKHNIHIGIETDVTIGTTDAVYYSFTIINGNNKNSFDPLFKKDISGNYEEGLEQVLQIALKKINL